MPSCRGPRTSMLRAAAVSGAWSPRRPGLPCGWLCSECPEPCRALKLRFCSRRSSAASLASSSPALPPACSSARPWEPRQPWSLRPRNTSLLVPEQIGWHQWIWQTLMTSQRRSRGRRHPSLCRVTAPKWAYHLVAPSSRLSPP